MEKIACQIKVLGKVQRVGFRYFVQKTATMLNVSGFAKNMSDGSVYIEAEGLEIDVSTFIDYCKKGPEWSDVTKLIVNEKPFEGFKNFEIKL
jgi:acylphosphatase